MKSEQIVLLSIVVLAAGASVYFLLKNKKTDIQVKSKTKDEMIKNILFHVIDNPTPTDAEKLNSYEDGYIKAWSDAINCSQLTFFYKNNTYNVSTGTLTKK
jgi:hypothetical protein